MSDINGPFTKQIVEYRKMYKPIILCCNTKEELRHSCPPNRGIYVISKRLKPYEVIYIGYVGKKKADGTETQHTIQMRLINGTTPYTIKENNFFYYGARYGPGEKKTQVGKKITPTKMMLFL